jgi:hypothetical protein
MYRQMDSLPRCPTPLNAKPPLRNRYETHLSKKKKNAHVIILLNIAFTVKFDLGGAKDRIDAKIRFSSPNLEGFVAQISSPFFDGNCKRTYRTRLVLV